MSQIGMTPSNSRRAIGTKALPAFFAAALAAGLLLTSAAFARRKATDPVGAPSGPRLTRNLNGSVPAREGERIRLSTELGSVVVRTQSADTVDYRIHLETDSSQKGAEQLLKSFTVSVRQTADGIVLKAESPGRRWTGRLWATLELAIPKNVNVDVSTGGGNIDTSAIHGRVTLSTAGGNITAGNISGPARLETGGGDIVATSVGGELYANTGGGHIVVGSVAGDATLHTSGGHIRVASIQGTAHLETGGGNITLGHSGAELTASTDGGEIQVGEAAGLVRAKTGGGGIRVVRMFGPTNLETGGGSIYLTQVDSPVKASTSSGGITAWFVAPPKSSGRCELQSSAGDIVVHLPRELPITVDAQVENGDANRVIIDPAFPLKVVHADPSSGDRTVRAEGALNGGGELLRLRTVAGNIRFVLSDADKQIELYKQQMAQLQKQTDELQRQLMQQGSQENGP
jgi:DUF4097 and DUF4098 domain-containing protein YvlB